MTKVKFSRTIVLLALAVAACSADPEVAKREYVKSGDRYMSEKKYQEAVIEYRNAVQQDARFGEARYKLAEAYVKINDPVNAYREYVRAAEALDCVYKLQVNGAEFL